LIDKGLPTALIRRRRSKHPMGRTREAITTLGIERLKQFGD
jgi:hypothetical protein